MTTHWIIGAVLAAMLGALAVAYWLRPEWRPRIRYALAAIGGAVLTLVTLGVVRRRPERIGEGVGGETSLGGEPTDPDPPPENFILLDRPDASDDDEPIDSDDVDLSASDPADWRI
jgi:hypothetical protein